MSTIVSSRRVPRPTSTDARATFSAPVALDPPATSSRRHGFAAVAAALASVVPPHAHVARTTHPRSNNASLSLASAAGDPTAEWTTTTTTPTTTQTPPRPPPTPMLSRPPPTPTLSRPPPPSSVSRALVSSGGRPLPELPPLHAFSAFESFQDIPGASSSTSNAATLPSTSGPPLLTVRPHSASSPAAGGGAPTRAVPHALSTPNSGATPAASSPVGLLPVGESPVPRPAGPNPLRMAASSPDPVPRVSSAATSVTPSPVTRPRMRTRSNGRTPPDQLALLIERYLVPLRAGLLEMCPNPFPPTAPDAGTSSSAEAALDSPVAAIATVSAATLRRRQINARVVEDCGRILAMLEPIFLCPTVCDARNEAPVVATDTTAGPTETSTGSDPPRSARPKRTRAVMEQTVGPAVPPSERRAEGPVLPPAISAEDCLALYQQAFPLEPERRCPAGGGAQSVPSSVTVATPNLLFPSAPVSLSM